eukprot:COSAG06_NODE_2735_length_6368_cov_19.977987_10_plen_192_part_00
MFVFIYKWLKRTVFTRLFDCVGCLLCELGLQLLQVERPAAIQTKRHETKRNDGDEDTWLNEVFKQEKTEQKLPCWPRRQNMVGGQQNDATEKTNPGTRGSGGGGDRDSTTSAEVLQDIAVRTTTENTADERAQRTHGRAASASRSSRCCRCSKLSWSSASLYALSFPSRSFANYGPHRHATETHHNSSVSC